MIKRVAHRPHAHLVGLLTFASGCVDVVTLMTIGGAFTSVITGNLVFVGRAVGTLSPTPALHALVAVAGYVTGVAVGSRLLTMVGRSAPEFAWPKGTTVVLAVECVILAAVNIAWVSYGAALPAAATDVMLTALALALGMQGAAARGIDGAPSTTYMTGALTALVEALANGRRRGVDMSAAVGLMALVAGAACSALLVGHASRIALLPPLAAVALVVAVKMRHHSTERHADDALDPSAGPLTTSSRPTVCYESVSQWASVENFRHSARPRRHTGPISPNYDTAGHILTPGLAVSLGFSRSAPGR